jgi:hypothetical protein
MEIIKRTLIILTATVAPMVEVVRANPETRLQDYLDALALWWKEFEPLPVDILFVENSGYNLKRLNDWLEKINAGSRIRVLQFNGDKVLIENLGKSAGEAEIFDECFRRNFITGYDYVVKSTGRLTFRIPLDIVDTRFFIIRSELYETYLLELGKEVNDNQGAIIEQVMLRRVCRAIADGRKWGQFESLPRYMGVSGSDGRQYNSLSINFRYFVKNVLHRVGKKFGFDRYF